VTDLISDEYLAQLRLYRTEQYRPMWGNGGSVHFEPLKTLISARHKELRTVLDYGCGHGRLMRSLVSSGLVLPKNAFLYDPGIPEHAGLPEPADLLISTDVLEHIEPDKLDGVLTHMRFLAGKLAYLNIHTGPANAILPDGRNAHLIQKPAAWWQAKLSEYFGKVERQKSSDIRPTFLCEQ